MVGPAVGWLRIVNVGKLLSFRTLLRSSNRSYFVAVREGPMSTVDPLG